MIQCTSNPSPTFAERSFVGLASAQIGPRIAHNDSSQLSAFSWPETVNEPSHAVSSKLTTATAMRKTLVRSVGCGCISITQKPHAVGGDWLGPDSSGFPRS